MRGNTVGSFARVLNLWLFCTVLGVLALPGTYDSMKRLRQHSKTDMDTTIRPVINQSDSINVTVIPELLSLGGLDEKHQLLDTTFLVKLKWKQEIQRWTPSEYGGIETIRLPLKEVWVPDLIFANSEIEELLLKKQEDVKVTAHYDGSVVWLTRSHLLTFCKVVIEHYPFDKQECFIYIEKMYSDDSEVRLTIETEEIVELNSDENDEWKILESKLITRSMQVGDSSVEIMIKLKRRPLFYVLYVMVPVLMLGLMNPMCFKIPAQSGERLSYCVSLFLTFVVLLNVTADSMPRVSRSISFLHMYITFLLLLSMTSTCLSIVIVSDSYFTVLTHEFKRFLTLLCIKTTNGICQPVDTCGIDADHTTNTILPDDLSNLISKLDQTLFTAFMFMFLISTTMSLSMLLINC